MIKYNLLCSDCAENFDSWFSSSKEFEKLKKSKFVICPNCNSFKVKKSLMAPSIINKKKDNNNLNSKKYLEIKNKLKETNGFFRIKHKIKSGKYVFIQIESLFSLLM